MKKILTPIRYFGGKGNMVSKLIPLIPPHVVYVEPFCGGASLFFNKKPSKVEVINDVNNLIINLYKVLQDDELFYKFENKVRLTLYSKIELVFAIKKLKHHVLNSDPKDISFIPDLDLAYYTYIYHNQIMSGIGIKSASTTGGSWSRGVTTNKSVNAWKSRMNYIHFWHERLLNAHIDSKDALECILYWDTEDTFFYIDPPYVHNTRKNKKVYDYEVYNEFHIKLINILKNIKGKVLLSNYNNDIYNELLSYNWNKKSYMIPCFAAGRTRKSSLRGEGSSKNALREEVIYYNYELPEITNNKDNTNNTKKENIINFSLF